jgi:hypothetical protein
LKAAKAFFRSTKAPMGFDPDRVITHGHGSYPRAIRTVLGRTVCHRTNTYLDNRLEQDHRGTKGRIRCMVLQEPRCCCPLLPRAWRTPQTPPLQPFPFHQGGTDCTLHHADPMKGSISNLGALKTRGFAQDLTEPRARVLDPQASLSAIVGRETARSRTRGQTPRMCIHVFPFSPFTIQERENGVFGRASMLPPTAQRSAGAAIRIAVLTFSTCLKLGKCGS